MEARNAVRSHGKYKADTLPYLTAFSSVAYDFVLVMRRTSHELYHYTEGIEDSNR